MIGMVQGAVAIPGIFIAIFVGYLADLRGRRFVAIFSLLLFGIDVIQWCVCAGGSCLCRFCVLCSGWRFMLLFSAGLLLVGVVFAGTAILVLRLLSLGPVLAVAVGLVLARIAVWILRLIKRWAARTRTRLDDLFLAEVERPVAVTLALDIRP